MTRPFRVRCLALLAVVWLCGSAGIPKAADPLVLWYPRPAAKWVEALPLGNGRLGAMLHGGVEQEHLQFNEATLWTGRPGITQSLRRTSMAPPYRRATVIASSPFDASSTLKPLQPRARAIASRTCLSSSTRSTVPVRLSARPFFSGDTAPVSS